MRKLTISLSCLLAAFAIALASCGESSYTGNHRQVYGRVYHGSDGNYYTRSYDDGQFWFWMYVMNSGSSSSSSSSSSLSGGSWVRMTSPPASGSLTPTSMVVVERNGQPTEEVEEATAETEEATIDENTEASEAAGIETEADSSADSFGDGASDSSAGGDSGSMGDAGGGDAGGGGDGGE